MDEQIDSINEKAEVELIKIEQEFKEKKKEIRRKKNAELRKYKEQQALKLGTMLCKHFNTYDIEDIIKRLSIEELE